MDIKAIIAELEGKIKGNPDLLDSFKSDPIKTVEGLLGIDLPDDQLMGVVDGLKQKLGGSGVKGVLSGLGEKIKGLFGK